MHHGWCHAEKPLKVRLGGWRIVNPGVVVDEREVLPLLGCERLAGLDYCDRTFLFIRKLSLNMCKSVVHSFERSSHPWFFTVIRGGCDVAGEIVHIVERQVNDESRSERRCSSETFFQLGIDKRALNDQIALTWSQPEADSVVWLDLLGPHVSDTVGRPLRYSSSLERVRRIGSVQFSSVSPFTRPNSAMLFVTRRSPSARA